MSSSWSNVHYSCAVRFEPDRELSQVGHRTPDRRLLLFRHIEQEKPTTTGSQQLASKCACFPSFTVPPVDRRICYAFLEATLHLPVLVQEMPENIGLDAIPQLVSQIECEVTHFLQSFSRRRIVCNCFIHSFQDLCRRTLAPGVEHEEIPF